MNLVKRNEGNFPSLIDEFFRPEWFRGFQDFGANVPAVNIKEADTDFVVELAAPGKGKEDFNIEVDDNMLTISSEAKAEKEEKDKKGNYTRKEFSYSSFKRSFTLPDSVNPDKIEASYENGILHLTLPKNTQTMLKPKRSIQIK